MRQDIALIAVGIGSTLLFLASVYAARWLFNTWKNSRAPILRLMMLETRMTRAEKWLQTIEPDWDDSKALTETLNEPKGLQAGFELVPRKGPVKRR